MVLTFFDRFLLLIRNIPNSKFGLNQIWSAKSPALEKLYLFHTNSDEDDFYMKIVALEKIYNFLVLVFSFEVFKMFIKIKQNFSSILITYKRMLP